MSSVTSVAFVGVGGQGVLLASAVTARAAIRAGFDVKTNEVHGMAQRGGSVIAQVRWGESVASPLVEKGTAKAMGALECVEALRYFEYPAPGARVVVSSQRIIPTTVSTGQCAYPADVKARAARLYPGLVWVDAVAEAGKLGSVRAANLIVLGAVSAALDLPLSAWEEALKQTIRADLLPLNLAAFHRGREF